MNTAQNIGKKPYLIGRNIDFWMMGGASVLFWLVMHIYQGMHDYAQVQKHFRGIPYLFATLALVCNFPHFMVSYQLAYTRGWQFIKQNWFQLLLVPYILIMMMVMGNLYYFKYSLLISWLEPINQFLSQHTGIFLGIGKEKHFGPEVLNILTNLMFFTVGWHYCKQSFGCTMVYASLDGYKIEKWQKNLIKWSLLGIWFYTLFLANTGLYSRKFYQATYHSFKFPMVWVETVEWLTVLGFWSVIILIFLRNYWEDKRLPSKNMITPMASMFIWWMPFFRHNLFYTYAVPFFHSLQYLPFSYKFLKSQEEDEKNIPKKFKLSMGGNFVLLIVTGALSFELLPEFLDKTFNSQGNTQLAYWFICAQLFINIHHYFIDNVIWHFRDPKVKKYLLGS